MDTTVKTTVALIARSLESVTRKQDIATVKWDGNHKSVPQVRILQYDSVVEYSFKKYIAS